MSSSSGQSSLILDSTNDFDKPIALRKGVRSCTKHPTSNFISYDHLSPSYRAFALSISSVPIPQDWKAVYGDPKWVEEMKALAKNKTWELVTHLANKKLVEYK